MTGFKPGDHVRALLWPELGTGTILTVTNPDNQSLTIRIAKVHWPDANQTSKHSFAALAPVTSDEGGNHATAVTP